MKWFKDLSVFMKILMVAVVLFVGSAVVAGIVESVTSTEEEVEKKPVEKKPVKEKKEKPKEEPTKDEPVTGEKPEEQNEAQEGDSEEAKPEEVTEADRIQKAVEEIVESDLNNTTITKIRVNEDASTNEEKYIVLIDLKWDVKNSAKTTNQMLEKYSDHLAAKMADNQLIYELVEFWEVPYLKEGDVILKRMYENTGDGMKLTDEVNMIQ